MRKIVLAVGLAVLMAGCAEHERSSTTPANHAYSDWMHHPYSWYDDSFWIWVDNDPECCADDWDIDEALEDWWEDLDSDEQDEVRDELQRWLDDHGLEPAEGQSMRDFVLDTASERWGVLTPEERQQWLSGREGRIEVRRELAQNMTPEQRAALETKLDSVTPEQREAARIRLEQSYQRPAIREQRFSYQQTNHPIPSRRAISASPRFRAAAGRSGRR